MDELPIIPIYYYVDKNMVKPDVRGFYRNPLDQHPLSAIWIDEAQPSRPSAFAARRSRQIAKSTSCSSSSSKRLLWMLAHAVGRVHGFVLPDASRARRAVRQRSAARAGDRSEHASAATTSTSRSAQQYFRELKKRLLRLDLGYQLQAAATTR